MHTRCVPKQGVGFSLAAAHSESDIAMGTFVGRFCDAYENRGGM